MVSFLCCLMTLFFWRWKFFWIFNIPLKPNRSTFFKLVLFIESSGFLFETWRHSYVPLLTKLLDCRWFYWFFTLNGSDQLWTLQRFQWHRARFWNITEYLSWFFYYLMFTASIWLRFFTALKMNSWQFVIQTFFESTHRCSFGSMMRNLLLQIIGDLLSFLHF